MRSLVAFCLAIVFVSAIAAHPAKAGPVLHTVAPGDTLWSIAGTYHVSVASLESRNHLTDQSILQLGQTIVVADGSKVSSSRVASVTHAHVASVTRRHGTASSKRVATRTRKARQAIGQVPQVAAVKNAVWVATHTGQAPAPPAILSYTLAERIIAFDEKVTHTALRYVGVPYMWGGTTFNGVDCSGFVQTVFERNGISLPRTADSQFEVGRPVKQSDLEPGDLVFFETYAIGASHVGIYLGGGRFIHASSSDGVRVDDLGQDYYSARYIGARRLVR